MIRWIDPTIGTAAFVDPDTAGHVILDVRGLVDGPANQSGALRTLVEQGVALLRDSDRLVVCCDYGISRSNTMAAALVAKRDGSNFDEALTLVRERTGEHRMDFGLVQTVRALFTTPETTSTTSGKVLVTGGTGLLGQWLERIANGELSYVRLGSQDVDLVISPFALDALVRRHRPDTIIHLANPRIYNTPVIVGQSLSILRNVTDVCREHGIFLVFPSSWVVLSGLRSDTNRLIGDDAPAMPYGNYAMSKALCEQMLSYLETAGSVQSCILRLSPIYGEGSGLPRFLFRTAELCRQGGTVITHRYSNGRPTLQLLHASDAARALSAAVKTRRPGRLNVAGNEVKTTWELAQMIAASLHQPITQEEVELTSVTSNVVLDIERAEKVFNWKPQVPLREGLRDLFHVGGKPHSPTRPFSSPI